MVVSWGSLRHLGETYESVGKCQIVCWSGQLLYIYIYAHSLG